MMEASPTSGQSARCRSCRWAAKWAGCSRTSWSTSGGWWWPTDGPTASWAARARTTREPDPEVSVQIKVRITHLHLALHLKWTSNYQEKQLRGRESRSKEEIKKGSLGKTLTIKVSVLFQSTQISRVVVGNMHRQTAVSVSPEGRWTLWCNLAPLCWFADGCEGHQIPNKTKRPPRGTRHPLEEKTPVTAQDGEMWNAPVISCL